MIPIEAENPEFYENTKVYECCIWCQEQTQYWHVATNRPICFLCADRYTEDEIETAPNNY